MTKDVQSGLHGLVQEQVLNRRGKAEAGADLYHIEVNAAKVPKFLVPSSSHH